MPARESRAEGTIAVKLLCSGCAQVCFAVPSESAQVKYRAQHTKNIAASQATSSGAALHLWKARQGGLTLPSCKSLCEGLTFSGTHSFQHENLQVSGNPLGRRGALISVHSTERGDIARGTNRTGDCKPLLILEALSKGAQEEMLSVHPVCPSPNSLRIPALAGQQGRGRAAPGQAQPRASDLGCGRVPPLAAASNVTEPSSECCSSSSPNRSLGGELGAAGDSSSSRGSRAYRGQGNGPALLRGWGRGLLACAEKQVHVCTAAKAQMGNFCTFTAQYLGLRKSKEVVVH